MDSKQHITLTELHAAHNYSPLEVVVAEAQGAWVKDVEGKRYLDMLSAYSAISFGHRNARINAAAMRQMEKVAVTSRAFFNDQLGPFCNELANLCGMEMVLTMNTGTEAVETALKLARRWGYQKKKVPENQAEIICFDGNFHGRSISIISFSTESDSKDQYGPYTPGFKLAPYGDLAAIEKLVTPNTVGVLVEPIQGEGGVIIPPAGFMSGLSELCKRRNVLLLADEVQTGLCRTGKVFCCEHEQVSPDVYILGKALGGGLLPLSAVVSSRDIMSVFTPGSHGSTFGGNPLACAVGREVVAIINEEKPEDRARVLGNKFLQDLKALKLPMITEIRGRGLFIGLDVDPAFGPGKKFAKLLKEVGILCKDTRRQTIRFAPPLTIDTMDLEWALEQIKIAVAKV